MVSFSAHGLPLLATLGAWFASTGAIVWLVARPARTYPAGLLLMGALALAGVVAIAATVNDGGVGAAYLSFGGALAIWGWHEMSFLTGAVAGPNRRPCPADAEGWARFRLAAATVIHHEIALALTVLLLGALAWGKVNMTGAETFALLFALRLSTKFNIFLGVPNFGDELLPAHLHYLKGYFRRRPVGALFPVTLALAGGACVWFGQLALAGDGGAAVSASLLAGLAALGVVEHVFLVIPLRDSALWHWASPSRGARHNVAQATVVD